MYDNLLISHKMVSLNLQKEKRKCWKNDPFFYQFRQSKIYKMNEFPPTYYY